MTGLVLPDAGTDPAGQQWLWTATGTEIASGTAVRAYEADGVITAESAGAAFAELVEHGSIWDGLDQAEAVSITVRPVVAAARAYLGESRRDRP